MFPKLTNSSQKLGIIREVDQFSGFNEARLNPHSPISHSEETSKTAISTNIYGPKFLSRDIEDILSEYRSNPFFKAKLNYALAQHRKTKKDSCSMPLNVRNDNLLATHRSQIKTSNELIQAKVAQIAARLQFDDKNRA